MSMIHVDKISFKPHLGFISFRNDCNPVTPIKYGIFERYTNYTGLQIMDLYLLLENERSFPG